MQFCNNLLMIIGVLLPISLQCLNQPRPDTVLSRDLLAIYLAIKHFRHFVEGCKFHVITDYKPLTFALTSKPSQHTTGKFVTLIAFPNLQQTSDASKVKIILLLIHSHVWEPFTVITVHQSVSKTLPMLSVMTLNFLKYNHPLLHLSYKLR